MSHVKFFSNCKSCGKPYMRKNPKTGKLEKRVSSSDTCVACIMGKEQATQLAANSKKK